MPFSKISISCFLFINVFVLTGCQSLTHSLGQSSSQPLTGNEEEYNNNESIRTIKSSLPNDWISASQSNEKEITNLQAQPNSWLKQFQDEQLNTLVNTALNNNYQLQQQMFAVKIAQQQLVSASSTFWPSLDAGLRTNRNKNTDPTSYTNGASLNLNIKYEIDVWGKLSSAHQQANLNFLSQTYTFRESQEALVVQVASAWFTLIESRQLLALFDKRIAVATQNLDIIESGYQQGLNSALDVYLTRNELNSEISRRSQQHITSIQNARTLEQLVGVYPKGELNSLGLLPSVDTLDYNIALGIPSELLSKKSSVQSEWLKLLAKNASLAYAHKQRFPSLSISGSIGDSADKIGNLFSTSALAWSLIGNLTSPIFDAGKLAAAEERVRFELKQTEQKYLETVFNAFKDVENTLSNEDSLSVRYEAMLKAKDNAIAAETLSFEQYQNGLVSYTTVLDAQRRAFDAQSTLIQLQGQMIKNRINLHFALGDSFNSSITEQSAAVTQVN